MPIKHVPILSYPPPYCKLFFIVISRHLLSFLKFFRFLLSNSFFAMFKSAFSGSFTKQFLLFVEPLFYLRRIKRPNLHFRKSGRFKFVIFQKSSTALSQLWPGKIALLWVTSL